MLVVAVRVVVSRRTPLEAAGAVEDDGAVDETAVLQERLERLEPAPVVRVLLVRRMAALPPGDAPREPGREVLPGEGTPGVEGEGEPEGAALPRLGEDQLTVAPRPVRRAP